MTTGTPRTPARRADAQRNREKILTAARTAFADADADVSMAEVSRRAGVGMATLYRNFPGRRELLEALYTDEIDAICEAAAVEGETPGAAFTAWLERFFAFFTAKRAIAAELLTHVDREDPVFDAGRSRVLASGRSLLDAARESGEVRDDLELEQILDMVKAIAGIPGSREYVEPLLRATLDGLRP